MAEGPRYCSDASPGLRCPHRCPQRPPIGSCCGARRQTLKERPCGVQSRCGSAQASKAKSRLTQSAIRWQRCCARAAWQTTASRRVLGHTDDRITDTVYTHTDIEYIRDAAEIIDSTVGSDRDKVEDENMILLSTFPERHGGIAGCFSGAGSSCSEPSESRGVFF